MSGRADLFVPPVDLDVNSSVPMHRQIYDAVIPSIKGGAIAHNTRVPSTRVMAKLLGVSRNTVLKAYDDLAADGFIYGVHGSGMRVRPDAASPAPSFFGLRQVIKDSGFPSRVVAFEDRDGNPMYLRF